MYLCTHEYANTHLLHTYTHITHINMYTYALTHTQTLGVYVVLFLEYNASRIDARVTLTSHTSLEV